MKVEMKELGHVGGLHLRHQNNIMYNLSMIKKIKK